MDLRFFEIYRNGEYLALLGEGMLMSAGLTVGAAILGFILATGLGIARANRIRYIGWIAACYVEFIRNTPLIVQLFFVAFGLPLLLGYEWPFWAHGMLALTLNFSAYFAEILRAGFQSIPAGQHEAAKALGVPRWVAFLKVEFPQAVSGMYPSLTSQFIFLFLTTGVISEIGVEELTHAGVFIDSRSFRSFEVFITLTVLYVAMSLTFKVALGWIEMRLFRWKRAR